MIMPNASSSSSGELVPDIDRNQYASSWILNQLQQGYTFTIDTHVHNGLILCKPFHADFVGPGATIGGALDLDCQQVIAVGNVAVQLPTFSDDNQKAYRIRHAWHRFLNEFAAISSHRKRAKKILNQFEMYFGKDITDRIPDKALAKLVGVLPQTIQAAR